ncbi:hypothetical protein EPLEJJEB_02891 [Mannheimia haemolytica]
MFQLPPNVFQFQPIGSIIFSGQSTRHCVQFEKVRPQVAFQFHRITSPIQALAVVFPTILGGVSSSHRHLLPHIQPLLLSRFYRRSVDFSPYQQALQTESFYAPNNGRLNRPYYDDRCCFGCKIQSSYQKQHLVAQCRSSQKWLNHI